MMSLYEKVAMTLFLVFTPLGVILFQVGLTVLGTIFLALAAVSLLSVFIILIWTS